MHKVKLGDVIKPRKEKASPADFPDLPFIGMEHVEAHTMRLLGTVPASTMRSAANRFYTGDVLYGRLRPYLNKVYKPQCDGLCSAEFIVFPKSDRIDQDFLRYRLNAHDFVSFASHLNTGDRPRVDFDGLSSFEFVLPNFLKEQQRIVAEIEKQFSRLDEAVTALKRIQVNLNRYKAALLKAAVEGKLTEKWRNEHPDVEPADRLLNRILAERRAKWEAEELAKMKVKGIKPKDDSWKKKYKEPAGPDTANLPELPEGWVWSRLRDLPVEVFDGPFGSNLKNNDYVSSGVRVIRLENIGSREFIDGKASFVTQQKYEQLKKHTVRHGDIIFSSFVANETRVVMLPEHIEKAINKADCFCIRVNDEAINKCYLETFLATRNAYEQLVGEVHGATRPRINTTQLKECLIPIPPIDEQVEIVSKLSAMLSIADVTDVEVKSNQVRADCLRQSILRHLFSDQLVTQ